MLNFPLTKSKEDVKMRKNLFRKFDYNGNGFLNISEINDGWKYFKDLPPIQDKESVVHRAFFGSRQMYQAKKNKERHDEFVTRNEFRYVLKYIAEFYQYQLAFDYLDTSDDLKINFEEFSMMKAQLMRWGIDMRDLNARWTECDRTEEGLVDFIEFCDWAIKQSMDLESDEEGEDEDASE